MDRRKFATRLSIFAAAFLPAAVRGQQPTSIAAQGNKQVYGEGKDKGQAGVYGVNFHGGNGVDGQSDSGNGVHGSASNGNGVMGESQNSNGVYGISNAGVGVVGNGKRIGVYGLSTTGNAVGGNNVPGYGVYGEGGVGVMGVATKPQGNGVQGSATGLAAAGILGEGTKGAFAAVFRGHVLLGAKSNLTLNEGDLSVQGKISKGGGAFKIDHPLAPDKKYLSHSFVESPDMMNVYNGNVTTDANGDATVMLPPYFAALNRDCRYQLTVLGQFAQAIVASKTKDNRFTIKTDKPNVEVSWQVTGIRQDAWANAHRIQVEEDKPAKELGSYLHPEVFGQPEEKSASFRTARTDS